MWAVALSLLVPVSSAWMIEPSKCLVNEQSPCQLKDSTKQLIHPRVACLIKQALKSEYMIECLKTLEREPEDEATSIAYIADEVYYSYCCNGFTYSDEFTDMDQIFYDNAVKINDKVFNETGLEYELQQQGTFMHFRRRQDDDDDGGQGRFYVNPGRNDACRWKIFKEILSLGSEVPVNVKTVDPRDERHDVIVGYTLTRNESDQIIEHLRQKFEDDKFGVNCPDGGARPPVLISTSEPWPQMGAADNPKGGQSLGDAFSNVIAKAILKTNGTTTRFAHFEQVCQNAAGLLDDPCNLSPVLRAM